MHEDHHQYRRSDHGNLLNPVPWRSILDGAAQERAQSAIGGIADSLLAAKFDAPGLPPATERVIRATLPSGDAGIALFYGYLSRVEQRAEHSRTAGRMLDQAFSTVAAVPMRPGLHGGFTGVGWVAEHLADWCLMRDVDDDPLESLDSALLRHLDNASLDCDYDLISGLAGFGVYALERMPHPSARRCIERVVHHLVQRAEERPSDTRWLTPAQHLPPRDREHFPNGYYVLGLAHGVAAIVVLLAGAVARGVAVDDSRRLLHGAVRFLLSCEVADTSLPYWTGPTVPRTAARSAWCHGDPGIAVALLTAARAAGEDEWARQGLRIALRAARRPEPEAGVEDPGLCHGAAGLAHLFNRAYQATGDAELLTAARAWFDHSLEMLETVSAEPVNPGFLNGLAGTGLALLSATSPIEPAWDRVLAMSLSSPSSGVTAVTA